MKLTQEQLLQRHNEFPRIIIDLSLNNMVIHKMIDAYIYGTIATKEEVYCQIILELAKTRDELMDRMLDEVRIQTTPYTTFP